MTVKQVFNTSAELDFPTVLPTLDLDFANTKALDPRITFTRSTGGSYVGADGLIKYAGVNEARFDHNPVTGESLGLLIEEQRTNYFYGTQPQIGTGGTISDGTATGADGVIAKKFVPTLGNTAFPTLNGYASFPIPVGSQVTGGTVDVSFSGYFAAVADGLYVPDIVVAISSSGTNFIFAELLPNLSNGGIVSRALNSSLGWSELIAPQITLMPFGMYKVTWSVRYTQGATIRNLVEFGIQCRKKNSPFSATGTYVADGVNGFQYSCVQYEIGAFPTSYIPTTTSSRTRVADNASMTGTNFSSWYNQSEGTVYSNTRITASPVSPGVRGLEVSDGTTNNRLEIGYWFSVITGIYIYTTFSGIAQYQTYPTITLPATTKQIATYSTLSSSLSYTTSISSSVNRFNAFRKPDYNTLGIGKASYANTNYLNGTISRLTYYPKALPPSQLQALTS